MSPTSIFGITPAHLLQKMIPQRAAENVAEGEDNPRFTIGDGATDDISTANVLAIICMAEAKVIEALRQKYQALVLGVPGEIVVKSARDGQTTARLGLDPVTEGTLKLYKNYGRVRSFADRTDDDAMDSSSYTLNTSTGVVTFVEPLKKGDTLSAVYSHGYAPSLTTLRDDAMGIAAAEVARQFGFPAGDGGPDGSRFARWETNAWGHLKTFRENGGGSIPVFEALALVDETSDDDLPAIVGGLVWG